MSELRDSRQRWWLMVLLIAGTILACAQRGALSVAAPFMMKDLNLSAAAMGILLSAFFWSYSFMQLPAGWLVDRIGVRRAYAWGFVVWSLASAVTGFVRNLFELVAARVLLGIGQSAVFPASARAVSNWRSGTILLSGFLSDALIRRGHAEIRVRKTFIAIGLAIACLIVPAGFVEDKMTVVWLLTTSLAGLGIASPNTWTLTQSVCDRSIVGTVSGIQNFGGNVGGVLAPALTGLIVTAADSFALALGLTGAILVAGIFSYCFLIIRRVELTEAAKGAPSGAPRGSEPHRNS